jgi:hypothetical protein
VDEAAYEPRTREAIDPGRSRLPSACSTSGEVATLDGKKAGRVATTGFCKHGARGAAGQFVE